MSTASPAILDSVAVTANPSLLAIVSLIFLSIGVHQHRGLFGIGPVNEHVCVELRLSICSFCLTEVYRNQPPYKKGKCKDDISCTTLRLSIAYVTTMMLCYILTYTLLSTSTSLLAVWKYAPLYWAYLCQYIIRGLLDSWLGGPWQAYHPRGRKFRPRNSKRDH